MGRWCRSWLLLPSVIDDLHAQRAAALECELGRFRALGDRGHHRAARADRDAAWPDDARALALEELAVDGDVAGADHLAVGEHAVGADDELGLIAELDRAVREHAVD